MATVERSGPPTLIVRSRDAVVRLTGEGVLWEEPATLTHIPYRAVVNGTAASSGTRKSRLRVEVDGRAGGRPEGYELVCGTLAAQTFVRALDTQRATLPATGPIPPVTAVSRPPARVSRYSRGELGLCLLAVAVVLNFLAVMATGRPLHAVLSCLGFFAWWGAADLAVHTFSLARAMWASLTRGVLVEAHYVSSSMRPGAGGRMSHTWVYEYTDLDGRTNEYVTVPSARDSEPPRTRTVTVVPGSDLSACSRTAAVFALLFVLPALLIGLAAMGAAALVAMPGVLLAGLV
ncbi:hypothetical protein OG909_07885 [Streptomyces sp. NBC_01754]|uniref:hypothetical protein n=1 Tax=Streptomyces sp. NBC_01754 TaxID=2975930 RepID=UPI002DDA3C9C|nr:hypothetical protein [Streptomyces sp. NBC_01754]WSC92221.1 hypothetical protein OG909_07885 [Streptomyces sp. NBC_01754]